MHPKGLSTPQRTNRCRIDKLPWIELLCTVWPGRDTCSSPLAGIAVLTHHSSRAGDPYGYMTKILPLGCFIVMSVPAVDKKAKISLHKMFKSVIQTAQKL